MIPIGQLVVQRLPVAYTLILIASLCVMFLVGFFNRPDLFFLDRAFNLRGTQSPIPAWSWSPYPKRTLNKGHPGGLGRAA